MHKRSPVADVKGSSVVDSTSADEYLIGFFVGAARAIMATSERKATALVGTAGIKENAVVPVARSASSRLTGDMMNVRLRAARGAQMMRP